MIIHINFQHNAAIINYNKNLKNNKLITQDKYTRPIELNDKHIFGHTEANQAGYTSNPFLNQLILCNYFPYPNTMFLKNSLQNVAFSTTEVYQHQKYPWHLKKSN